MTVSVKIPEEDLLLLSKLKNDLRERNIKVTNKDLLDMAVKFSIRNQDDFLHELLDSKKMNRKEATKKFFESGKRYDFGDNWLEDIDTTL